MFLTKILFFVRHSLGPGIIYAGAAIGVSHLVQSTRAGADFAVQLVWAILLANIIKYPFFAMGSLYAVHTKRNLIHGYARFHKFALVIFLCQTLATMFIVQSAIVAVTAGLLLSQFQIPLSTPLTGAVVLLGTCGFLSYGKYQLLDQVIKWIVFLLVLFTFYALFKVLFTTDSFSNLLVVQDHKKFSWLEKEHIFFLAALMGWMPAPMDISIWQSLWVEQKLHHKHSAVPHSLLDFQIGYWLTTILAIVFLLLGALVMYPSDLSFQPNAVGFSKDLITMYAMTLKSDFMAGILAVACIATMISTTLTCHDAFARVLSQGVKQLRSSRLPSMFSSYRSWLVIVSAGSLIITLGFSSSMRQLIDLATTISFILAPLIALLNYKVVKKDIPSLVTPLKSILIIPSFLILALMSVCYLYYRYIL